MPFCENPATKQAVKPLLLTYFRGLPDFGKITLNKTSFIERGITFFLMFVIINVSTGAKEKGITAGIAVASIVGLEAMFAGPICGASMNPARSMAPAVVSGNMDYISHQWVYLTAPFLGACLAVLIFKFINPNQNNS